MAKCAAGDDCSFHGGQESETREKDSSVSYEGTSSVVSIPFISFHFPNAANLPIVPKAGDPLRTWSLWDISYVNHNNRQYFLTITGITVN